MLEEPKLAKERIIAQLSARYDLNVRSLEFLPVGNDARAWSYRVEAAAGLFFLKLRLGPVNRAALIVPRWLLNCGIASAVAPMPANRGLLYTRLDGYTLALYPYIHGESRWDMPLSAAQWRNWGAIMREIHDVSIPPEVARQVPPEVFAVKWLGKIERVEALLARGDYQGEAGSAVAAIWRQNADLIELCRSRYRWLGAQLESRSPKFRLCHADIHPANIVIDARGDIHIVDWDETLLAPKERDLMFFIDDGRSDDTTDAFFDGYGDRSVDALALAYYKYDWVMQEFDDYGERVCLAADLSDGELALAQREFARLFEADDVIDRAQRAYANYLASAAHADEALPIQPLGGSDKNSRAHRK